MMGRAGAATPHEDTQHQDESDLLHRFLAAKNSGFCGKRSKSYINTAVYFGGGAETRITDHVEPLEMF